MSAKHSDPLATKKVQSLKQRFYATAIREEFDLENLDEEEKFDGENDEDLDMKLIENSLL